MNALLCGAGHSIRKILRKLRLFCALYRFTLCQLLAFLLPPAMCAPITAPKFNSALHWAIMKIENGVSQGRLARIFHASRTPGQNHSVFDADEHPARELPELRRL
jgi:hypothetical protein